MSSVQSLLLRLLLRALQLIGILLVYVGLRNLAELSVAIEAFIQGTISVSQLCWKILPVTGAWMPASAIIIAAQLILPYVRAFDLSAKEPWLNNPMWKAKHIRLSNRGIFWILVVFFLLYVEIIVPFSIATEKTPFMVLCGVIGLALLLMARVFWLNRKWNTAELRIATLPGIIGGPFSGVAILQQSFPVGTPFDVCLKCIQDKTHRSAQSGGGSKTITETVWSSTLSIDKPLPPDAPERTLIPFSFAVPFECEPTSVSNAGGGVKTMWNLVVNEKDKVGFGGAVFTVPVFRTADSRHDFQLDEELVAPFEQKVDLDSVLARLNMTKESNVEGVEKISFGVWDRQGAISVLILSIICSSIIAAFFWFIPNVYGAMFASIFPGVFLLAGLFVLLDMLLWGSSIEIDQNEIRCTSGWLGFRKQLETSKLEGPVFSSEFDARKQNGEWYRVDIGITSKQSVDADSYFGKLTVVKRLNGRSEANAVAQWLRQEVGVS